MACRQAADAAADYNRVNLNIPVQLWVFGPWSAGWPQGRLIFWQLQHTEYTSRTKNNGSNTYYNLRILLRSASQDISDYFFDLGRRLFGFYHIMTDAEVI